MQQQHWSLLFLSMHQWGPCTKKDWRSLNSITEAPPVSTIIFCIYKIMLHSTNLMWRTFPKEPCPSTFLSSNCCGSAFSEPSLTRCVMLISLTDTSSWREDDNKPERELHQRGTQNLWQMVQTKIPTSKPGKSDQPERKHFYWIHPNSIINLFMQH